MKFSGKMCLMIILKVRKNLGFTLSLEDTFFEKPQGGQIDPLPPPPTPAPVVLGLRNVTMKRSKLKKQSRQNQVGD